MRMISSQQFALNRTLTTNIIPKNGSVFDASVVLDRVRYTLPEAYPDHTRWNREIGGVIDHNQLNPVQARRKCAAVQCAEYAFAWNWCVAQVERDEVLRRFRADFQLVEIEIRDGRCARDGKLPAQECARQRRGNPRCRVEAGIR